MRNLAIFVLYLIVNTGLFAQGVFSVKTNKTEYSYGEVIEVSASLHNNTDSTLHLHPECVTHMHARVVGVQFNEMSNLSDGCEWWMKPGQTETWVFKLDPAELGFPVKDGEQIIYAYGYHMADSVRITAPKYYGGRVEVRYNISLTDKRDTFFAKIKADLIRRDTLTSINKYDEIWSVTGMSIDSLVMAYMISPYYFGYMSTYRMAEKGTSTVTSVESENLVPCEFRLYNNYPNPFNPVTTIAYSLDKPGKIRIEVFDLLGNIVDKIFDGHQTEGIHRITYDGSKLSSGTYIYRLLSGNSVLSNKFILLK